MTTKSNITYRAAWEKEGLYIGHTEPATTLKQAAEFAADAERIFGSPAWVESNASGFWERHEGEGLE